MIQGAQVAQGRAKGGSSRNDSNPFAKRLKAFHDVNMEKFFGDKGPMVAFK